MYKIDREGNRIEKLQKCSFSDLGFKEREHIQEWIAKDPTVLGGEELLIIQKEFDGFADTSERPDLLALDKQGSLVIIENKRDDSGRGVTWQALRYASYCSSLSKDQIRKIYQDFLNKNERGEAEDKLSKFYDGEDYENLSLNKGVTQRIILIAANFRKEVTSVVLWLLNFKIRLQCFRATPYQNPKGGDLFLNVEQFIPTQDTEEYMISMAEKAQDDLNSQSKSKYEDDIRKEFWTKLLDLMNRRSKLYQTIGPRAGPWIGTGSDIRGANLNMNVSKSSGRVDLYIDRKDKRENEFVFDELQKHKEQIEKDFGGKLDWERLDDRRACRISAETRGNFLDKDLWNDMHEFMVDSLIRLESALENPMRKVNQELKEMPNGPEEGSG